MGLTETRRAWIAGPLVGLAGAMAVGGPAGVGVGVAVAAVTVALLRRVEPRAQREERRRVGADLPVAADLLAAALRAGAPPGRAAGVVGEAIGGPVGERLVRVGRALRFGSTPEEAWTHLAELPEAGRMARAAVRSAERGGALAGALDRLAEDLRAARGAYGEAAARRAGVLVVLPLGLCFLPAFMFSGVLPTIVAVLGGVLHDH